MHMWQKNTQKLKIYTLTIWNKELYSVVKNDEYTIKSASIHINIYINDYLSMMSVFILSCNAFLSWGYFLWYSVHKAQLVCLLCQRQSNSSLNLWMRLGLDRLSAGSRKHHFHSLVHPTSVCLFDGQLARIFLRILQTQIWCDQGLERWHKTCLP